MSAKTKTTPLYRIENPTIESTPDGEVSHEDLIGQWFRPDLSQTMSYLCKSTQSHSRKPQPVNGAQLVIAEVPTEQLSAFHVSKNPVAVAFKMDVESDNYIIPRDGSIKTTTIPLDATLEGLKGKLGSVGHLLEARKRIEQLVTKIGEISLQ